MNDGRPSTDKVEDPLDCAIQAVLAETPPPAAGQRVLAAVALWSPNSVPLQIRPRAWRGESSRRDTTGILTATAVVVFVAIAGGTWYFSRNATQSVQSVDEPGNIAMHDPLPQGAASASRIGAPADDDQMKPLIHGAWVTIPNVQVLVAGHSPFIVANGGPAPLHLGAWRKAGDPSGLLHVWDWSKSPMSRLVIDRDKKPVERSVPPVLTSDGRFATWDNGDILDLHTGTWSTIELTAEELQILSLRRFSPNGTRLAIEITHRVAGTQAEFDHQFLRIVEFPSGRPLCEFGFVDQNFFRFCFSQDGAKITAIDVRGQLVRRDATTGNVLREYAPLITGQVMSIDESADGRFTAAVELTGDAWLWNTASGELLHRIAGTRLRGDENDFPRIVRFSPDGRYLAVAATDLLSVIEVATGEAVASLRESLGADLHWSDDGREITVITLASVSEHPVRNDDVRRERYDIYPSVHIWDWRKGERVQSLTAESPQ